VADVEFDERDDLVDEAGNFKCRLRYAAF